MRNLIRSLRFLTAQQFGLRAERRQEHRSYRIDGQTIPCDVYKVAQSAGTIVTINGFAPLGSRDLRFVALNEALAYAGFTVISPTIPEICGFKIDPAHIDLIGKLLQTIAADASLDVHREISVLAPSFSGSLVLLSAFRQSGHIRAVCMIGSYAHAEDTLSQLFLKQEGDEYGRLILMKNFLHWSTGKNAMLGRAFDALLHDNYFKPESPVFPGIEKKMSASLRRTLDRLRTQPGVRAFHWKKIRSFRRRSDRILNSLCLVANAKPLKTAVTLIHGREDSVIPSKQSEILNEVLQSQGVETRLVITPLISHGDAEISPAQIPAIVELCAGFLHFFKNAAA